MTADAGTLRFFVDESALGLGKTLAAARKDTIHTGHKLIPECPLGADDTVWIPAVAARDLVVVARDRHIRTKPEELAAFHDAGLRAFWIGGKKDLSTWEWLRRVVRHWDAIEEEIRIRGSGPWCKSLNERSVTEIPLRPPP